ncbi:putative CDP-alcohol phosphatidyltransferase [Paratrimastix pyriformis]|uniref:CDP-alcohol phosphatidyltransferase n=1 Tax=Paratrimastix pyriformis TaxID=342808 RepID=A0ABQ8V1H3_9EUKA|nr:putative CDP-alcohol phosphatidyltransferase [Paratrimastix pyriformis]
MPYITEKGLKTVSKSKYNGIDDSLFYNYIGNPFYNKVVTFIPRWMAPNVVTALATLSQFLAFLLYVIWAPNMTVAPRWVYFATGALIFSYQTLDNIDGKHARRTGNQSPLGQLFDHGSDCFAVGVVCGYMLATMGIDPGWKTYLMLINLEMGFFLPTWEEYHTGRMYLGPINGADEGVFVTYLMQTFTGFVGGQFWKLPLSQLLPLPAATPVFLATMTVGDFFLYGLVVLAFGSNLINIYTVFRARWGKAGKGKVSENENDQLAPEPCTGGFFVALLRLIPLGLVMGFNGLWCYFAPHFLLGSPYWFVFAISTPFLAITSRLIIDHVSGQEYPILRHPVLLGYLVPSWPPSWSISTSSNGPGGAAPWCLWPSWATRAPLRSITTGGSCATSPTCATSASSTSSPIRPRRRPAWPDLGRAQVILIFCPSSSRCFCGLFRRSRPQPAREQPAFSLPVRLVAPLDSDCLLLFLLFVPLL